MRTQSRSARFEARDGKTSHGPDAMSETATLRLAPGQFFGGARLSHSSHGINVSHRIAIREPAEVLNHTHEDAHFILVTGGDYVSAAAGRPAADRAVLVYNPPGTTHRDHFQRGRGSFFAISLDPPKAAAALTGISTPDAPLHLVAPAQHAMALRIARCCASQATGLSLEALCLELLGSMDRHDRREPPPPDWLQAAVELLHDRYVEDLTIADIAAGVGVHPVHLARSFRRHLRCTPGEFARFRRLEKAVELLGRTGRPLAEIALSCGFADQSHLNKVFARSLGLPPGEYRRLAGVAAARSRMFQIDKSAPPGWVKLRAWAVSTRARARKRT
jgi:AraC family transcriptional regulator